MPHPRPCCPCQLATDWISGSLRSTPRSRPFRPGTRKAETNSLDLLPIGGQLYKDLIGTPAGKERGGACPDSRDSGNYRGGAGARCAHGILEEDRNQRGRDKAAEIQGKMVERRAGAALPRASERTDRPVQKAAARASQQL